MVTAKDRLNQHRRKQKQQHHAPFAEPRSDGIAIEDDELENEFCAWRMRKCDCKDGMCMPSFRIEMRAPQHQKPVDGSTIKQQQQQQLAGAAIRLDETPGGVRDLVAAAGGTLQGKN